MDEVQEVNDIVVSDGVIADAGISMDVVQVPTAPTLSDLILNRI